MGNESTTMCLSHLLRMTVWRLNVSRVFVQIKDISNQFSTGSLEWNKD